MYKLPTSLPSKIFKHLLATHYLLITLQYISYCVMSLIHLSCTLIFFIVAGRLLNVSGFKLDNDSNDGTQAM